MKILADAVVEGHADAAAEDKSAEGQPAAVQGNGAPEAEKESPAEPGSD